MPEESVALMADLSEAGSDVTWFKDSVPLSVADENYQTISQGSSFQAENTEEYKVQGGEYESMVPVTMKGEL